MVQDNLDGLKSDPKNLFSQQYPKNSVRNLFSDTLQVWEHCITSIILNVDEMGGFFIPTWRKDLIYIYFLFMVLIEFSESR